MATDYIAYLEDTFKAWYDRQPGKGGVEICLKECVPLLAGEGVSMNLLVIAALECYDIQLHCTPPPSEDVPASFTVFAPKKSSWENALNEKIREEAKDKSLPRTLALLAEGLESVLGLGAPGDASTGCDKDGDGDFVQDEFGEASECDGDVDTDLWKDPELIFLRKVRGWMKKTQKFLESLKIDASCVTECGELHKNQKEETTVEIVDPTQYLLKEVRTICDSEWKTGISVDPIEENLYHLNVILRNINPDTRLGQDLANAAVAQVEFRLHFNPFLYPFWPPEVEMVCPRLCGLENEPLIGLDVFRPFQFSYWNHASFLSLYLEKIKFFFEGHLKLEVDSCLARKGSCYLTLEDSIHQLGMLYEIEPQCSRGSDFKMLKVPVASRKNTTTTYWQKGTGYGFGFEEEEQDKRTEYAKFVLEKKEKRILILLQEIEQELAIFTGLLNRKHRTSSSVPHFGKGSWFWFENFASEPPTQESMDILQSLDPKYISKVIGSSALIPFLEDYFQNHTFIDFSNHFDLFEKCSHVLSQLISREDFFPLFATKSGKAVCLAIEELHSKAKCISEIQLKYVGEKRGTNENTTPYINGIFKTMVSKGLIDNKGSENVDKEVVLGKPSLGQNYVNALKPRLFETAAIQGGHFPKDTTPRTKQQITRISNEIATLSGSLPCDLSSSIFVRMDPGDMTTFRFMITGPEDTPYANGCYFFDFKFSQNYPISPPEVHFRMDGNKWYNRINPNLYKKGKVCLSLLGTWQGKNSETWSPTCTALQVLVSIQSLILNKEPYFNEPGYEKLIGTKGGNEKSEEYNTEVVLHNVEYGINYVLESKPYPEFDQVTMAHFALKRETVLEDIEKWLEKIKPFGKTYSRLRKCFCKSQKLLSDLPKN